MRDEEFSKDTLEYINELLKDKWERGVKDHPERDFYKMDALQLLKESFQETADDIHYKMRLKEVIIEMLIKISALEAENLRLRNGENPVVGSPDTDLPA